MRRFKRTLAVLLIVCSILSVTSCGEKQPADTGMDICREFCKDVYSGDATKLVSYFNGDSISGSIEIKLNSQTLKHKGIKVELHGVVEKYGALTYTTEFLFLKQELIPAGEIIQEKTTLEFCFRNPYLKYESYKGNYASVKYFTKLVIDSNLITLISITYEKEFAVVNPSDESILYENDFPIKLRVGVKNILSLSIQFEHCNYNCRGTLKGFVTFNLVNTNIQFMEVQFVKREVCFDGKKYEPEYISRYELIDGGPIKNEIIPIRFFLKSYNLTPSYPDIEGIFGVKYFLNLVVVDDNDNRYFKLAEINLYRLFRDRRAHFENFNNNGLYISEPFFEDEYYFDPNTILNDNDDNMRNDNYDNNYYNNSNYSNYNRINKNNRFKNEDNNFVLNIPDNRNNNNNNLRNTNQNRNNNNPNNNVTNREINDFNNDIFNKRNNFNKDNYNDINAQNSYDNNNNKKIGRIRNNNYNSRINNDFDNNNYNNKRENNFNNNLFNNEDKRNLNHNKNINYNNRGGNNSYNNNQDMNNNNNQYYNRNQNLNSYNRQQNNDYQNQDRNNINNSQTNPFNHFHINVHNSNLFGDDDFNDHYNNNINNKNIRNNNSNSNDNNYNRNKKINIFGNFFNNISYEKNKNKNINNNFLNNSQKIYKNNREKINLFGYNNDFNNDDNYNNKNKKINEFINNNFINNSQNNNRNNIDKDNLFCDDNDFNNTNNTLHNNNVNNINKRNNIFGDNKDSFNKQKNNINGN